MPDAVPESAAAPDRDEDRRDREREERPDPDPDAPDAPDDDRPERGPACAGTGAATTTGTPEGSWAPVMRCSSLSPARTGVIRGVIPAAAISRLTSRRCPGVTRVTTLPDSPARAVRPPRCR